MLAGSVKVTAASHSFVVQFNGNKVLFRIPAFGTALWLRKAGWPPARSLFTAFSFLNIQVHAQIASLNKFRLFPDPGPIVRLLLPPAPRFRERRFLSTKNGLGS